MENLYILLDATDRDYAQNVAALKGGSSRTFSPRLSLNGTEALVQIKEVNIPKLYREFVELGSCAKEQGDEAWALTLTQGTDWTEEEL